MNETVGTITLVKHFNSIKLTTTDSSSGSISVSLPSIVRTEFSSTLLDVNPAQGTRLIPTASTPPGIPIFGWLMGMQKPSSTAVDGPLSFITHTDSRGLRPLDFATEYINTIDGSPNDVRLTATQNIPSGSRTAQSLAMHGAKMVA